MQMIANLHFHLPKPEPYQRFGSGDGERKTWLTRQIAFEPLPASVLFALVWPLEVRRVIIVIAERSGLSARWPRLEG